MFKIQFDTKSGQWVVRISRMWGLYWSTACRAGEPTCFDTYEHAQTWVRSVGIDKVYADRTRGFETQTYDGPAVFRHAR